MGTFEGVIAELKTRRDKITAAIEALEELGGGMSNESSVRENRTVAAEPKTARRVAKKGAPAKAQSARIGRPPGGKAATIRERIQGILRDGPQTSGAIIACLKVGGLGVSDGSVYCALNVIKAKGLIVRGNDGVWSLKK